MVSTRDPETMTADERRREVAALLARGLLRRVRAARTMVPTSCPLAALAPCPPATLAPYPVLVQPEMENQPS